jgi:hypothetical protein
MRTTEGSPARLVPLLTPEQHTSDPRAEAVRLAIAGSPGMWVLRGTPDWLGSSGLQALCLQGGFLLPVEWSHPRETESAFRMGDIGFQTEDLPTGPDTPTGIRIAILTMIMTTIIMVATTIMAMADIPMAIPMPIPATTDMPIRT